MWRWSAISSAKCCRRCCPANSWRPRRRMRAVQRCRRQWAHWCGRRVSRTRARTPRAFSCHLHLHCCARRRASRALTRTRTQVTARDERTARALCRLHARARVQNARNKRLASSLINKPHVTRLSHWRSALMTHGSAHHSDNGVCVPALPSWAQDKYCDVCACVTLCAVGDRRLASANACLQCQVD